MAVQEVLRQTGLKSEGLKAAVATGTYNLRVTRRRRRERLDGLVLRPSNNAGPDRSRGGPFMTETLAILLKITIVIFMAGNLLDLGLRVDLKQALRGLRDLRFSGLAVRGASGGFSARLTT